MRLQALTLLGTIAIVVALAGGCGQPSAPGAEGRPAIPKSEPQPLAKDMRTQPEKAKPAAAEAEAEEPAPKPVPVARNLLRNGGFERWGDERTPASWTNRTRGGKFSKSTDTKLGSGEDYCVRVELGEDTNPAFWQYIPDADVVPGEKYVLRYQMKSEGLFGRPRFLARFGKKGEPYKSAFMDPEKTWAKQSWREYRFEFELPEDAEYIGVLLSFWRAPNRVSKGALWFDNCELYFASEAPDGPITPLSNDYQLNAFGELQEETVYPVPAPEGVLRVAAIGDFGRAGQEINGVCPEEQVAGLVKGWKPHIILGLGDNNWPDGAAETIDANIGQFYHEYIYPYHGKYGSGAPDKINRFFACLGNHEYFIQGNNAKPHHDYFTMPGNEKCFDFAVGPAHFFAIDNGLIDHARGRNPVPIESTSTQGQWLKRRLAASKEPLNIVFFHYPPYSSFQYYDKGKEDEGKKYNQYPWMRWPFKEWGADVVIASHVHNYERLVVDGIPYFINGSGGVGVSSFPEDTEWLPESRAHSNSFGAQLIEIAETSATFKFVNRHGAVEDTYTLDFGV